MDEEDHNPFRYVGGFGVMQESDDLLFMRARYYDVELGRFLSEDPIWSDNLYAYGGGNPVNNLDPLGTVNWRRVGWGVVTLAGTTLTMMAGMAAASTGVGVPLATGLMVAAVPGFGVGVSQIMVGLFEEPEHTENVDVAFEKLEAITTLNGAPYLLGLAGGEDKAMSYANTTKTVVDAIAVSNGANGLIEAINAKNVLPIAKNSVGFAIDGLNLYNDLHKEGDSNSNGNIFYYPAPDKRNLIIQNLARLSIQKGNMCQQR
jgi:RHS repeat-associated protein